MKFIAALSVFSFLASTLIGCDPPRRRTDLDMADATHHGGCPDVDPDGTFCIGFVSPDAALPTTEDAAAQVDVAAEIDAAVIADALPDTGAADAATISDDAVVESDAALPDAGGESDLPPECVGNVPDICPVDVEQTEDNLIFRCWCLAHWHDDLDHDGRHDGEDECRGFRRSNPCDPDTDHDGVGDDLDNCTLVANNDQADGDADAIGDVCDNCVDVENTDQTDTDGNGFGDACDLGDRDYDGILDNIDNCQAYDNPNQEDADGDGDGDLCDGCPDTFDPDQLDTDQDGVGDACDCAVDNPYVWHYIGDECMGDSRVLEVIWTPGSAAHYMHGPATNEYAVDDEEVEFSIPAEVERLVPWITCWTVNLGVAEHGNIRHYTYWAMGEPLPVNVVDNIDEMSLQIELPLFEDERTVACQWEVYGLAAGQQVPEECPYIAWGPNGWGDFIWESVVVEQDDPFGFTVYGEHSYRWLSPDGDTLASEWGSDIDVPMHGFVPVLPDADRDRVVDTEDDCPNDWDPTQVDDDEDGVGNQCDLTYGVGGMCVSDEWCDAGLICVIPDGEWHGTCQPED